MRSVKWLMAMGALAVALSGGIAAAQEGDSVRGGGQVVFSSADPLEGAGDSLGFQAQERRGIISGTFQYVATSMAGEDMDRWSGQVTCLEVMGNMARFGGTIRSNSGSNVQGFFDVQATDNGPPDGEQGNDLIFLRYGEDVEPCEEDFDEEEERVLARGNLRVHDAE